jgi:hypothetical protein
MLMLRKAMATIVPPCLTYVIVHNPKLFECQPRALSARQPAMLQYARPSKTLMTVLACKVLAIESVVYATPCLRYTTEHTLLSQQ